MKDIITVYIDGACEPKNPGGYGGYGVYISENDKCIKEISGFIEKSQEVSNNVAEYLALVKALEWLRENNLNEKLILIKGDSKLVINQMNNVWKIRFGLYKNYAMKARKLLSYFSNTYFKWIPRDDNWRADELSKAELHKRKVQFKLQPN